MSRRDRMIVARQFIAWNRSNPNPSRRARSDPFPRLVSRPDCGSLSDAITPSLRDGSLLKGIPGNKLPGYDHLVPPGQTHRRPYFGRFVPSGTITRNCTKKLISLKPLSSPPESFFRKVVTPIWHLLARCVQSPFFRG